MHPIAAKQVPHIDILQMWNKNIDKTRDFVATEVGEENEADVTGEAGTGGESSRKKCDSPSKQ